MSGELESEVFNTGYRPVRPTLPTWPTDWAATWPATTATLVSSGAESLLVDAVATVDEGRELVDWIGARGKTPDTIYVTHAHADHFFGLEPVLAAFPRARAVALDEIVPLLAEQATPEWMTIWNATFPSQIPEHPPVPEGLGGRELSVGGHPVRLHKLGQSDVADSTVAHLPDTDTVIAGDTVYNGVHVWMYNSDHKSRMDWIDTLGGIEALKPKRIIAGHTDPDARDEDAARLINETRDYIADFDATVGATADPQEIISTMNTRHPGRGNPYTLWLAAYAHGG